MRTATYSPEDNKLRIYLDGVRLDDELGEEGYKEFKAAGYKWASKQECFVCARWTPTAEDWALELCDEIDDEDYSPEERSADRAERFSGYRDKRRDEAHGHADSFEAGPAIHAHHRQERAERSARRQERHKGHALSQWSKAEYWQTRTAGVISHALFKSSAHVRRGRLLRLEADQRKQQKAIDQAQARYALWLKVSTMEGADDVLTEDANEWNKAGRLAYTLANDGRSWWHAYHPTNETANEKAREIQTSGICNGFSPSDLLTKTEYCGIQFEKLTPRQVAQLYLADHQEPGQEGSYSYRWAKHYELRTTYEKAMLANEGGMAADVEMEKGGWLGAHQIHKVNKSPATGRVVSVTLKMPGDRWGNTREGHHMRAYNVERLPEGAYRPPTDEERESFTVKKAAEKAERKATTPKAPPLINPTDNDAEQLQALWNATARERHEAKGDRFSSDFVPSEVRRMTQADYSRLSKGSYSSLETRTLHEGGKLARRSSNLWTSEGQKYDESLGGALCKLRVSSAAGSSWSSPRRVIVITDKPQKPLPLDWESLMPAEEPEAVAVGTNQKELF